MAVLGLRQAQAERILLKLPFVLSLSKHTRKGRLQ